MVWLERRNEPDGRQREEKGITLPVCIELRRWGKNTRSRRRGEKKSGDIFGGGPWRLQESGKKEGNLRGIFLCVLATAMIETGLFLIRLKYIVLAPTSLAVSTKFDRQTAAFQPSLERVGYSVR